GAVPLRALRVRDFRVRHPSGVARIALPPAEPADAATRAGSLPDALPISVDQARMTGDTAALLAELGIEGISPHSKIRSLSVEMRSEEHTSELQSRFDLVCRLLLEKRSERSKPYL